MDPAHFDRLAIAVGQRISRRLAISLLAALGLTGPGSQGAGAQLGGLVNGQPCTSGFSALPAVCVRKKGTRKKFCRQAPWPGHLLDRVQRVRGRRCAQLRRRRRRRTVPAM